MDLWRKNREAHGFDANSRKNRDSVYWTAGSRKNRDSVLLVADSRKKQVPPEFSAEIYSELCPCKATVVAGSDTHMTGLEAPEGIFEENVSIPDMLDTPGHQNIGVVDIQN